MLIWPTLVSNRVSCVRRQERLSLEHPCDSEPFTKIFIWFLIIIFSPHFFLFYLGKIKFLVANWMSFFFVTQLSCSFPTLSIAALILFYSIKVGLSFLLLMELVFFYVTAFLFVSHLIYYRLMRPMNKVESFAVTHFPSLSTVCSCIDAALCFLLFFW